MRFNFRKRPGGGLTIPKIVATAEILTHGEFFKSSIRVIIAGPSGVGKTNVATALILDPNGLKFCNFYLFSPSWDQEKYRFVLSALRSVKGLHVYEASAHISVFVVGEIINFSLFIGMLVLSICIFDR